jgi:putative ABC transport system permease protein
MRAIDTIGRHLRHATRVLVNAPGFTLAASLTLALGIGANTAIFSLVKTVILAPLPYADSGRLVMIWNMAAPSDRTWLSAPEVVSYANDVTSFSHVGAYIESDANLTGDDNPERVPAASVTGELFDTLGVTPLLGRTLSPADSAPGAPATVVLSHGLWQRRFGGVPSIVGERVQVNGQSREIVGVMPPEFSLPVDYRGSRRTELWIGATIDPAALGQWGNRSFMAIARLTPGATAASASTELNLIEQNWVRAGYIENRPDDRLNRSAVALRDFITGGVQRPLFILMGAVGVVLLIACANIVNLLLARADSRRREIALRGALGAERGDILRQLLSESLLLSTLGAAAGVLVAHAALQVLATLRPAGLPRVEDVAVDPSALLFTAGLALACGLIFGLAPALQITRQDLARLLNEGGRGAAPGKARLFVRRGLVVLQLAFSVMLVVAAGLLLRTLVELQRIDLGFDDRRVLTGQVLLPPTDYPDGPRVVNFFRQVTERLQQLPGVVAAGGVRLLPLTGSIGDWSITLEGRDSAPGENPNGDFQFATPGYLHAMGLTVRAGRWFTAADREDAPPVVVVNETMAARYWPGGDAVGQRFRMGGPGGTLPMMTIVGIVKTSRHNAVVEDFRAELYVPHAQMPTSVGISAARRMTVVVKAERDPLALAGALRDVVRAVDPNVPVADIQTMEQVTAKALAGPRFAAFLLGVFAVLALSLAAVGTYASLSLLVAERSSEIGIRMALGAERRSIIGSVLREGLSLAAGGMALGFAGALFAARVLETLLFGVSAFDPLTFAVVPAVLGSVALLATWAPAYRAASVNPVNTLRHG